MKFIDVEMLKDLSLEDMEQLRRELKILQRRVHEEVDRRELRCAYCGALLDSSVHGFRYCTAWHRYLDAHQNATTVSRLEFERRRALTRIKSIRKATQAGAAPSETPKAEGTSSLKASLSSLRIRRILREFQTITGKSLRTSLRDLRSSKTVDR